MILLLLGLFALSTVGLRDRTLEGDTPGLLHWQPWSKERVAEEVAQGHVVFVAFTADWCVSCQANEQAFIEVEAVREAVKKTGAVLLRADWTRKNAAIRAGLAEHARASVPWYLVYPPVAGKRPEVLPEVLTSSSQIVTALERAAAMAPGR